MNRKQFLSFTGLSLASLLTSDFILAMPDTQPTIFHFKDDGQIPNSKYPVLLYPAAFNERGNTGATFLEARFAANNWTNAWRWGVYLFHHYHSNTHEVLGVFSGNALLHLGGETGKKLSVHAGDVMVIPAGVGHKCISHSNDFTVVGAYPNGLNPDLYKGESGERPETDQHIAAVPFPATDPFMGRDEGLKKIWK